MEKIITYENLSQFAYSNDKLIEGEIRGIVLSFYGLGGTAMHSVPPGDAAECAAKGIVYLIPYCNPWCWMNRQSVDYVDEVVAVICHRYSLDPSTVKIVSTGGSMGGLSALVYCAYAKINARLICIFSLSFIEISTVFSSGMSILTGKRSNGALIVVLVGP